MIRFADITIDRHRRCIARGGMTIFFDGRRTEPPMIFRLACILLLAGPKNKQELVDLLYADDKSGGPLWAMKSIDVRICDLKKRFAAIGIELRSEYIAGWRRYFAEPAGICDARYLEAAE